jgi:multidrug efflux pump subunit AcrB
LARASKVPPGPPEANARRRVYGPDYDGQIRLADKIRRLFEETPGVVDTDWYVEDAQPNVRFIVDREKAAYNEITAEQVSETLATALGGRESGLAHIEKEKEDVPILLQLPRAQRSDLRDLQSLKLVGAGGKLVPLSEITRATTGAQPPNIYRKNLQRVVYVTADVAGREESPIYAILRLDPEIGALAAPADQRSLPIYKTRQPFSTTEYAMKWDGEWHVTYEVFRDLV